MATVIRVLFVDDSDSDVEITQRQLVRAGFDLESHVVHEEAELRGELERWHPDIILSDFAMPRFDGLRAFEVSQQLAPRTPFIFLSGGIRGRLADAAIDRGAADYVEKGDAAALSAAISRALRMQ